MTDESSERITHDGLAVPKEALMFPVSLKNLYATIGDKDVPLTWDECKLARKVVWDETDGYGLGIVSPKFKVVAHSTVIEAMLKALQQAKYNPEELQIIYRTNYNKSLMKMDVLGLGKLTVPEINDDWNVGISACNGLDGYHAVEYGTELIREICSNGLTARKALGGRSRNIHAGSFSKIQSFLFEGIATTLDNIQVMENRLGTLTKKMLPRDKLMETVTKKFGVRFAEDVVRLIYNPPQDNPLFFVTAKDISAYDALSVVTYVSGIRREGVGFTGQDLRSRSIEALVRSWEKE